MLGHNETADERWNSIWSSERIATQVNYWTILKANEPLNGLECK